MYKTYVDKLLKIKSSETESDQLNEFIEELKLTSLIFPVVHQDIVSRLIGTTKLEIVIQEEVDKIIDDPMISELEKFTWIFNLFNINKREWLYYIEQFVNRSRRNYVNDMIFIKLMHCYRTSEIDETIDRMYLNILGEIKSKGEKGINRYQAKGRYISQLEDMKLLEQGSNSQQSLCKDKV